MKKLIAMLLALSMILAFAGCAKTEEAPATTAAATEAAPVETEPAPEDTAPASAEEGVLDGGADIAVDAAPAVMTHEEFMAAELESIVCVETYVQATQSWWDNKITVYCQSPDGAYFVYELACSQEDAEKLVPGTKIRVTGERAEWAGEVEIMYPTFEFVEGGDTFIAEALDVTELLGTDELIAHQNEFVAFKGLTIEAIEYKNGEPGDDIYVTVGYNGASYSFCVEIYLTGADSDVYTTVGTLNVGDTVNIEGFLYWYEGVNTHITGIELAA